jgi:hypothetical protein
MSLRPSWRPGAVEQLKHIGWHPAEYVDAAVQRFARTGRGDLEHLVGQVYLLRIGPYRVWFEVHREEGVLEVLRVYGPHPKR